MDAPTGMGDAAVHQAAVAVLAVHIIQIAKSVPFLSFLQNPAYAKTAAAALVLVSAAGVKFQMEGTVMGGGHLELAWPMLSELMDTIEHLTLQWGFQEFYYTMRYKRGEDPTPVSGVKE